METKLLYKDRLWEAITSHPKYDLGRRELAALVRFLPVVAAHAPHILDVLHLASSTGREVPAIVSVIPNIKQYLLADIVPEVAERSCQEMQAKFPHVVFQAIATDIELPGAITHLRWRLTQPTLIALVANGVILSNRQMDSNIHQAMEEGGLFLLTIEEPHDRMFDSYLIPPVLQLLSESGHEVNTDTVRIWYDNQTSRMHMACDGEDLLVSYKPTTKRLHQRMVNAGFVEVAVERYADLHMLAGLYRRK